jgi:hypothetical protein
MNQTNRTSRARIGRGIRLALLVVFATAAYLCPAAIVSAQGTSTERRQDPATAVTGQLPPVQDLSPGAAERKASAYLQLLALPTERLFPASSPTLTVDPLGRRVWTVRTGGYMLQLDSATGELQRLKYEAREWHQLRNEGRGGRPAIRTEKMARAAIMRLAGLLGFPRPAYIKRLRVYQDGDPRIMDGNRTGYASAEFVVTGPNGIPFGEYMGPAGAISIDTLDGALLHASMEWRVVTAANRASMSAQAAKERASDEYRAIMVRQRNGGQFGPLPAEAQLLPEPVARLEYAVAETGTQPFPRTAVLSWAVKFGSDTVWVDATSGQMVAVRTVPRSPRPASN